MRFHGFAVRMIAVVLIGSFALLAPAMPAFATEGGSQQQSVQAPAESGGWLKAAIDWVASAISGSPGEGGTRIDPSGSR